MGRRTVMHDPNTGRELPMHVTYVPPRRAGWTAYYKYNIPNSLLEPHQQQAHYFASVAELMRSDVYKRSIRKEAERLSKRGEKRRQRLASTIESARSEYDTLLEGGVNIPHSLTFDRKHARWYVNRFFGTGWCYRATAYSFAEAMALYSSCTRISELRDVIGEHAEAPALVEVEATVVDE